MSEDDATTPRGHQQQHQSNISDHDPNNSIIGKMRSRVSNILPQTLSKWFSPVGGGDESGNRNGSLRRRRDEMQQQSENIGSRNRRHQRNNLDEIDVDDDGSTDDEGGGGGGGGGGGDGDNTDDEPEMCLPPSKKSKLNVTEEYSVTNPYLASSSSSFMRNRGNDVISTSTPSAALSNSRRQLNLIKKNKDPPYMFSNSSTDEPRYLDDDEDVIDTDVLEVIPEHDEVVWEGNRTISSRRSLNISSSLRRQTLSNVRRSAERNTSTLNINEDEIGEEEEEEEEEDEDEIRGSRGVDGEENNSEIGGCRDRRGGSSSGMAITRKRRRENSDENTVVLTNGKASSNVIQGRMGEDATESESGDSQYSSSNLLQQQRLRHKISKSSRLFGAGVGGSGGIGSKSLSNRNTTVTGSNSNVGLNFYTHLEGKKSLFSDKNMNIKTALNSSTISLNSLNRRQSFNASLYGSTSALSDSRLLNISSPFYKGRTTYGGASAYSKYSSFSAGSSLLNQPGAYRISRTPTSIRPSSSLSSLSSSNASLPTTAAQATASTSDGDVLTISNTAKRILELMNQFTTPLSDAKKMANTIKVPASLSSLVDHKKRFNDDDLKQSRAIRMSAPTTPYSRPKPSRLLTATASNILPPPTNELHVPSMANLLQMKKLQNNIEKVREIANSSKSNLNTRGEYKLPSNVTSVATFDTQQQQQQQQQNLDSPGTSSSSNNSNKHVSKIRSRITSSKRHSNASARNAISEDETLPPVNLPEISLPFMKSVPKIDITIPKSNQNQPQPISKVHTTGTATTTNTISSQNPYNNKSIIASTAPKETSSVGIENYSKSNSTPNMIHEFKFSMPLEIAKNSTLEDQQNTVEPIDKFNFSKPIALDINSSTTELAATINKPHSIAFENFKFQSPISKVDETQKVEIATKSTLPAVPQQLKTGSVLDVLKKKQDQTASTASSASTIATETDSTVTKGFGDQFKMPKNQWECQICMIPNNNNLDKCAACQTPRKDNNTSTNNNSITASVSSAVVKNSFGDMFKPKADSWECSECMIINKNELNECAACKASKPGSSKSGDKLSFSVSSSSNQSIFSVPNKLSTAESVTQQEVGFKNLIEQQSSKWECPACMTRNEQTRSKCVCCEQEKPGSTKSNNSNLQKPNLFGFGAATTSKFNFGFSAEQKEDDLKKKDTEHSTATVTSSSNNSEKDKVGTTETNTSNKAGFSFGSSMVSSSTLNTSQNTASKPPLTFGFKPTSSTLEIASGKDVPDVSTSSNFKFGSVTTQKSGTQETTQSSNTTTEKKTFTFGVNKPVDDTKLNTEKTFKFGSPAAATSAGSSIDKSQDQNETESKSEISKQSIFGTPASLGESKIGSASSSSSTSTIFGSSSTSFVTQKPDSTADSSQKNLFKFGESSTNKTDKNVEGGSNKKLNFSFGSTDNTGAATSTPQKIPAFTSAFSSPNAQKTVANDTEPNKSLFGAPATPISTAISTAVSTVATTSSLFTFGKPSTVTTSPFAAAGTNTNNNGRTSVTSTNTTTNTPIFGSLPTTTVATTSTTSIFGSQSNPTFGNTSSLLQSQQQGQQQQTGSIFGSNFSSSASNNNSSLQSSGVSQQPSNLFTFGSSIPPKTDNNTNSGGSIFGSVSSTTTTNKPFTFGSNQTATPTTTQASSSFVFGSASSLQKPSEGTSMFGSGSNSAFSAPAATTINSSQQQQQQQQKSETKPTFGSKQQQTLSPFGNSSTGVSSSSNIPAFGSNASAGTSIFGSATPTFGSSGFGTSSNTTFGNTAATAGAPPTFGSSTFGNIGDSNLAKKPETTPAFNFGAAQSTSSSGLFTFGANNNNNNNNNTQQQPFAFSASSAPSFNFSGSQETTSQPFQFGGVPMKPSFNFSGIETTSNAPFQFSAAGMNAANNIFAPTPGSSATAAQAARRKMRPRRTQPR